MPTLGLEDFGGGLWIAGEKAPTTEQAGFAVPPNALLQADNLDYLPTGAIRGRRGSSKYSGSSLGGPVTAVKRYYARPVQDSQDGLGHGGQDRSVGTIAWHGHDGIAWLFDESQASANVTPGDQTYYLVAFRPFIDAPIPATATVTGIRVLVAARAQLSTDLPTLASVRLINGFAPVGADKSTGAALTSPAASVLAFGGAGDVWSASLTAADINSTGFGVGVSWLGVGSSLNTIEVLWIGMTVYYTAALNNVLVAGYVSGGSLVYEAGTAGVFTPITGGTVANPSRRPRVVSWPQKGKLFFFDGVNEVKQFDGNEMATVETATVDGIVQQAPRKGPYATLHKNRLWATDPGEITHSVYATDINDETSWRPVLHLACNDDRGGMMTGLESFGEALLIFKDTAIFRFLGDVEFGGGSLVEFSKDGCVAPDSIAVTPYGVVYLGREGLWLTDGNAATLLSEAIRPLFVERDTQNVYPNAVGVYYPRLGQYWLHLDPGVDTNGYVLSRVMRGGELGLAWARIPDLPMNAGTVQGGSGDEGELYLGDLDGFVWLRDSGDDDDSVAYSTIAVTAQALIDPRRELGRVYRAKPLYRGLGELALGLRYDQVTADDVTLTVGAIGAAPTFQEPRDYVSDKTKFGRFVSIRVQSAEAAAFELHRVDLEVRRRGGRVWR